MTHAVSTRLTHALERPRPSYALRRSGVGRLGLPVVAVLVFVAALLEPRAGRADPVRSAARLQHRFRRAGRPGGRSRSPGGTSPLAAVMVGGLRLVLAVASRPDRVDARADRRGADRPAARARGVRASRRASAPSSVTRRSLVLALWGAGGLGRPLLRVRAEPQRARGDLRRLARGAGGVAGAGCTPRAWSSSGSLRHPFRREVRASPGPGPQHLAVLRVARRRRSPPGARTCADLALLGRRPVQRHARRLRGRPGPPGRAWRSSPAGASTRPSTWSSRCCSGFLALQLVHDLRVTDRGGRARLATVRRVVRL